MRQGIEANVGPVSRLLLLDGNSLGYRAFFALPTDMATASGQVTNAVFGFTSMVVNLLANQAPDAVVVAFDRQEPTFRHKALPTYKANRDKTPDILVQQMGLIRQVSEALGFTVLEMPGYEADDLLATVATTAAAQQWEVVVVTGDRDAYQLVEDPWIKVLYNRRGVSDYVLYDEEGILERTGVRPSDYPAFAALRGDPSDNLPGVPGVGEKTAARLINQYGSIENLLDHLEDLRPKLADSLACHRGDVISNMAAIPLVRDVPLELDLNALGLQAADPEAVRQLFGFLEFRSLYSRLSQVLGWNQASTAEQGEDGLVDLVAKVERFASPSQVCSAISSCAKSTSVAVQGSWSAQPGRSTLLGLAILDESKAGGADVPEAIWVDERQVLEPSVAGSLGELFASVTVDGHHLKELIRSLGSLGIDLAVVGMDTAVAGYLVEPSDTSYRLDEMLERFCATRFPSQKPKTPGVLDLQDDESDEAEIAAQQAAAVAKLGPALRAALEERAQLSLYEDIERPLITVLAKMELLGIRIDRPALEALVAELGAEASELDKTIQDLAGTPFKVGSTPQLREILYNKLGLAPQRRTKTGYSTDAASLERLRGQHPIIEAILRWREVEKLRSTFGVGLLAEIAPDGRIHASFNQTVARTGRLSSDQPNLHNIPVRTEDGRRFRRAFVPSDDYSLLVADYDQIELRVIAHLSGDPGLVEAFAEGRDVHAATAARVFSVPEDQVTPQMRSKAKMVSYGLAYGMEAYGLSRRLGVPIQEAEAMLTAYFEAFPRVRSYMDQTVDLARKRGYTETPFGRRRPIPELASNNYRLRQAGERQAMNAGIQGLAADLFKVALVQLDGRLAQGPARLVLQVHDEVLVEVPTGAEEEFADLVSQVMVGAADLSVPLSVHVAWGSSWEAAKA